MKMMVYFSGLSFPGTFPGMFPGKNSFNMNSRKKVVRRLFVEFSQFEFDV